MTELCALCSTVAFILSYRLQNCVCLSVLFLLFQFLRKLSVLTFGGNVVSSPSFLPSIRGFCGSGLGVESIARSSFVLSSYTYYEHIAGEKRGGKE